MKPFLDDNFVLETKTAQTLYFEHAKKMPIIDYHCHLSPKEIANDKNFDNLSQAWLNGDHYKWRAMRANGINEKFITGDASDYEKFQKWAETVPETLRNPLYHWTHMELKAYFGIEKLLSPETAKKIYEETREKLQSKEYSVRGLMRKMNVELVCTTDDPVDTLEHHQKIKEDGFEIKVLPTWRPDKAMAIDKTAMFSTYLKRLEDLVGVEIGKYQQLIDALEVRHDFFAENGCKLSDHGLEAFFAEDYKESEIKSIFKDAKKGIKIKSRDVRKFKTALLFELARMDHEKGWTQQFHVGAMRNNNTKMLNRLGPDTGYDSIGDFQQGADMAKFMDMLEKEGQLTKTIIYNLNPADNALIATMTGNYQDGSVPGKIQFGSGWWFLDQKQGMEDQMNTLSNLGLLSKFVGMLTDSRSFLSYPRHDYFRRILCNLLGNDVENGLVPDNMMHLGKMVENISYHNAKNYFGF